MLRIRHRLRHRNMPKGEGRGSGPLGRINRLRKLVTALVRHERIEGNWDYLDESRGYVERLMYIAKKHGDQHAHTMEMMDYWLLEKDLVHKMFKVLVPRYSNRPASAITSMYKLPTEYPGGGCPLGILELKDNPWPPVIPHKRQHQNSLVNILLREAAKDYRAEKAALGKAVLSMSGDLTSNTLLEDNISRTENSESKQTVDTKNVDETSDLTEALDNLTVGEQKPDSSNKDSGKEQGTPV